MKDFPIPVEQPGEENKKEFIELRNELQLSGEHARRRHVAALYNKQKTCQDGQGIKS